MPLLQLLTDCSHETNLESKKGKRRKRETAEDGLRSVHERVERGEVRKEEESEKICNCVSEDWDNRPI